MRVSEALATSGGRRPVYRPIEMPMQSRPGRYGHDGSTRLINCYAEEAGREAKTPFPVYAVDGLQSFATLTDGGECRGMLATDEGLYVVSGRQCYFVDASASATVLGGVPGDGPVFFARNRATPREVILVADGLVFLITNITDFAELNEPNLQAPTSCDFIDGYILFGIPNGRFQWSAIDDADDIAALNFATAEGSPDGLKRVYVYNRTILLLGEKTTELFDSTGDQDDPFQRSPGAFYETGCLAPASVVTLDSGPAWVNDTGEVVIADLGGGFHRISTHSVEQDIDSLSDADKAKIQGFVYERRGHEFYVLTGVGFTWVYDTTTGQWHERESHGESRWRAQAYAFFNGKHIVGDFESGTLYELDPDTYDENGNHLTITLQFHIHGFPYAVRLDRLRFDMIPGVGLNSSDLHDSDPQLMLSLSKNGGKSFGNEKTRSIGKIGQHTAETKFSKLGTSNEDGFVVKASVSAAVIRGFTGISGEMELKRR
jgi:hypothetical protein